MIQNTIDKIIEAKKTLLEAKKNFYMQNFYEFNRDVLAWPDIYEPLHRRVCNFIQDNYKDKNVLLLLPRGTFKCISPDTKITLSNGMTVFADTLSIGDEVMSWDKNFKSSKIVAIQKNPLRKMYELVMRSGNILKVSGNHPIMTVRGFVNAENLTIGKRVLAWGGHELGGKQGDINELWLLGLMIGDEACTKGSITIANKDVLKKTENACLCINTKLRKNAGKYNYSFSGVWQFMRKWGIANKTSWYKKIPDEVFNLDIASKSAFIEGYFAADGTITKDGKAGFTTVSENLAYGLHDLLKTIGIFSTVNFYRYKYSSFYRIDIKDPIGLNNFSKLNLLGKIHVIKSNQDGYWRSVPKEWREVAKPQKARKRGYRIDNKYDTSYTKFNKFAKELNLEWASTNEVIWDEIQKINEYQGESIDIEVEGTHTFLAGGVVTHNSSIVTVGLTLWEIAKNTDTRILIANATSPMAVSFLGQIKRHLQRNITFQSIFGDLSQTADQWREDRIFVSKEVSWQHKDPTVWAYGIGGNLTGSHFDMAVLDDVVSRDNIGTKEQIEKVKNFYKDVLDLVDPMANGNKKVVLVGTTWHYDDLYSWLEDPDNGFSQDLAVLKLPAYEGEWGRGDLLFPERLNWKTLEGLKAKQGSAHFAAQYLLNPIPEEDQVFRPPFKRYEQTDIKGLELRTFFAVDPAISQEKYADNSAMVCVGVDKNNAWYILDVWKDKVLPNTLIEKIFSWHQKWKPISIGLETVAYQRMLQYQINDEMKKRGVFIPLKELKHSSRSKEDRIRGLQPRYEQKSILHPDKQAVPDIEYLEDELVRFPLGAKDDIIDALSSVLELAFPPRVKEVSRARRYNHYPA